MISKIYPMILATLIFICLTGCTDGDEEYTDLLSRVEEMNQEMSSMNSTLQEQEEMITELNQTIARLSSNENLKYNELQTKVYILDDLVKELPTIKHELGNVKHIEPGKITIDYINKVEDQEQPNGYYLENNQEENIEFVLGEDTSFFVVDGASVSEVELDELMETSHSGLYHFYIVNNEVVQVLEQYLH